MKKKIISLLFVCLILYCLLFPTRMAASVSDGLTLWYHAILPTLLPFSIFSNIIIRSGVYDRFFERLHPAFRLICPVRSPLIYPLLAGFLFGFPLGSKICADLCQEKKVSSKEAEIISAVSNNFGPAFIYNYLYRTAFDEEIPAVIFFASCYLPPLILGRLWLQYEKSISAASLPYPTNAAGKNKKKASGSQINMEIMDAGIMDGFTTMIRLAGYILLSALLADMFRHLPLANGVLHSICIGAVEITNGIYEISLLSYENTVRTVLAVGIVNFGGLSGLCQTWSVTRAAGIHIKNYICFKLLCSLFGMMLVVLLRIYIPV